MPDSSAPDEQVLFTGLKGRVLASLLQWRMVRYHRVQLGAVEHPREYRRFLGHVVAGRILASEGRLGVFGVGSHTDLLISAAPALLDRIDCFTDNSTTIWGHRRFEKLVVSPPEAVDGCDVIFLSTAVFQRVMEADLRRLGFQGAVLSVDDHVPPHWFLRTDDHP